MDKKKDETKKPDPEFDFTKDEFPELFGEKTESKEEVVSEVKEEPAISEQPAKDLEPAPVTVKPTTESETSSNNESIVTPAGETTRMVLTRLGVISSNLAIIFAILSFLSIVSVFLSIFYYMLLFCIIVLTLFTILADPNFRALFSGGSSFTEFIMKFAALAPMFMAISGVFSILSIILLATDKHSRHTGRIVFSGISIGIVVILALVFVFSLAGKGGTQ